MTFLSVSCVKAREALRKSSTESRSPRPRQKNPQTSKLEGHHEQLSEAARACPLACRFRQSTALPEELLLRSGHRLCSADWQPLLFWHLRGLSGAWSFRVSSRGDISGPHLRPEPCCFARPAVRRARCSVKLLRSSWELTTC